MSDHHEYINGFVGVIGGIISLFAHYGPLATHLAGVIGTWIGFIMACLSALKYIQLKLKKKGHKK